MLDHEIIDAFECHGEVQVLQGGEGRSIHVGDCVFKPIDHPDRYSWSCDLISRISQEGFRVPEPRKARDGSFVYRGWAATSFEPGDHVQGRWQEKIEVLRSFHVKLHDLEISEMPPSADLWSLAHEITWQARPLPTNLHPDMITLINIVFGHYQRLPRAYEIIHSDFCGNILFHDWLAPCVIDFSPAYGCVEYAEAIMIADGIAWENAPLESLDLLTWNEGYRQHFLRAINFRMIVAALFLPKDTERFLQEYTAFKTLIDHVLA
jgi:uncharacterized protein (TIGR02569 family)